MSQPNLADESGFPDLAEEQPVVDEPQAPDAVTAPAVVIPTQKQKTNVYTVMLIISLVCIVTACILLFWEITLWGSYPWWNVNEATPNLSQWVPPNVPIGIERIV